jgi:hypothetical protein
MSDAFDKGSAKLMQERFSRGDNIVVRKRLNVMINTIKGKLGFTSGKRTYGVRRGLGHGLSSRTIPVGNRVSLVRSIDKGASRIKGEVIQNDEIEIVIKTRENISSVPGDVWDVRYRFGSSTWAFCSLTMNSTENILELSHTDNIRFVNRRKFPRATVRKTAMIAAFETIRKGFKGKDMNLDFYEATVTEISGPGLLINSDIEVSQGDRVLIMFELKRGCIVQDIGEIRGVRDTGVSRSIGVELVGLDDSSINELISYTNSLGLKGDRREYDYDEDLLSTGAY